MGPDRLSALLLLIAALEIKDRQLLELPQDIQHPLHVALMLSSNDVLGSLHEDAERSPVYAPISEVFEEERIVEFAIGGEWCTRLVVLVLALDLAKGCSQYARTFILVVGMTTYQFEVFHSSDQLVKACISHGGMLRCSRC